MIDGHKIKKKQSKNGTGRVRPTKAAFMLLPLLDTESKSPAHEAL